ncbi:hypothetical protein DFJ74DRAFT_658870 [Hyaloraphidium curvatum]|nr:hypothetical protein DFJ74DRAFT_658870 [Hyaloraphidium curvatum]
MADPDWLTCAVCLGTMLPSEIPVVLYKSNTFGSWTACQHIFCRNCISPLSSLGPAARRCPTCRKRWNTAVPLLETNIEPLKIAYRSSYVSCPHECGAAVQIWDLDAHSRACPFAAVACPHEGCGLQLARKDMEKHKEECPRAFVACENEGCGEAVRREEAEAHAEECPKRIVRARCIPSAPTRRPLTRSTSTCRRPPRTTGSCWTSSRPSSTPKTSSSAAKPAPCGSRPACSAPGKPRSPSSEGTSR